MFDVITIGDATNDLFIRPSEVATEKRRFGEVKICFEHGSKISIDEVHNDIGGSACNVAVGLSRLGFQTAVLGATGTDQNSEKIRGRLTSENVDDKMLKSFAKIETNFSVIIVYKGERTVLVYRGLKDYSLIRIPKNLSSRWIYLGPVDVTFEKNYKDIVRLVSERNINLAVNPGHRQIIKGRDNLKRLIYIAKVLILNREEAIELTQMGKLASEKDLLRRLKKYGPEVVVITDGENGAFAVSNDNFYQIKSYKIEVVDNTGAGDAFSSGFLATYIKNPDLEQALKWGIMNSTEVITAYGAQTMLANQSKLEKLVAIAPDVYKFN